jgi:hypothetical protein
MSDDTRTLIYKRTAAGDELLLGYVDEAGEIGKLRWDEGVTVGRWDATGRVFRRTAHDEHELGSFNPNGAVHSHGLFTGGALGWVEADGVVIQAGLILGEEEVGRVDGPQPAPAAAALLLLFLPDDAEAERRLARQ